MRKLLILAVAALMLTAGAIPDGVIRPPRSQAATPSPTSVPTRAVGSTSHTTAPAAAFPPDPSTLKPCPSPSSSPGPKAQHPPQPGDSFCDARQFRQPGRGTMPPPLTPGSKPLSVSLSSVSGPDAPITCPNMTEYPAGAFDIPFFTAYGTFGDRTVAEVSPAYGSTCETVFATSHMGDSSGNCPIASPNGCWTEMGWMWSQAVGCGPAYEIYTFEAPRAQYYGHLQPGYGCFPQFPIGPGSVFSFAIIGNGVGDWYDELYWDGQWNVIDTTALASGYNTFSGKPDTDVEVFTNQNGDGYYTSIPDTPSYNGQVETCSGGGSCSWTAWTYPPISGTVERPSGPDSYGEGYYAPTVDGNNVNTYVCGPAYLNGGASC